MSILDDTEILSQGVDIQIISVLKKDYCFYITNL